MNKHLSMIVIALMIAQTASAATTKKKKTGNAPAAPIVSAPAETQSSHDSGSSHQWKLSGAAGMGSLGSKFHLGVTAKAETPINFNGTPLTVGGETGFLLGPSTVTTWAIPLMGIATYEFPHNGGMEVSMGLGLGLSIYHSSITVLGVSASDTSVFFTGVLTPGVKLTDKYYAELPFGSMGGGFVILPSVGMHF
jgi:hypothetical protein